jgi:hypothetical protein
VLPSECDAAFKAHAFTWACEQESGGFNIYSHKQPAGLSLFPTAPAELRAKMLAQTRIVKPSSEFIDLAAPLG